MSKEKKTHNFSIGQTVYLVPSMYKSRKPGVLFVEGEVVKIGRKYLTVIVPPYTHTHYQFCIDSLVQKTDWTADYHLYLTAQEIFDQKERDKILQRLRRAFDFGSRKASNLTLAQLKQIDVILETACTEAKGEQI